MIRLCKEDVKNEAQQNEKLYQTAEENLRNTVEALLIPILTENSISEPLTDHGFLTWITMDEKTSALAAAQENMKESAVANQALLNQAKERAKDIIEDYIKNVGQEMGKDYTVQWIEYEETENQ